MCGWWFGILGRAIQEGEYIVISACTFKFSHVLNFVVLGSFAISRKFYSCKNGTYRYKSMHGLALINAISLETVLGLKGLKTSYS